MKAIFGVAIKYFHSKAGLESIFYRSTEFYWILRSLASQMFTNKHPPITRSTSTSAICKVVLFLFAKFSSSFFSHRLVTRCTELSLGGSRGGGRMGVGGPRGVQWSHQHVCGDRSITEEPPPPHPHTDTASPSPPPLSSKWVSQPTAVTGFFYLVMPHRLDRVSLRSATNPGAAEFYGIFSEFFLPPPHPIGLVSGEQQLMARGGEETAAPSGRG